MRIPKPDRMPITEGFIVSQWITTNGFDVEYFVSDGTRIEILESDDGSIWTATNFGIGEITTHPNRLAAMIEARDYMRANGLRTIASPEQRAAKWFKGDDSDYTSDKRDASVGMTLIAPGSVAAKQAADKAEALAAEQAAKAALRARAFDAEKAARDMNAAMLAARLNAVLRGE